MSLEMPCVDGHYSSTAYHSPLSFHRQYLISLYFKFFDLLTNCAKIVFLQKLKQMLDSCDLDQISMKHHLMEI